MKPYATGRGWTLYHGDCRDVLPTLSGVDAILADPPYGMSWNTDSTRFTGFGRKRSGGGRSDWGDVAFDNEPFDPAPLLGFPRVVIFGVNHFAARVPVGTTLVWIKREDHNFGSFLSDAELAWMKGGHGVYCFRKQFPPPSRILEGNGACLHPCQKPTELLRWCMERMKVPAGGRVVDPYCGSASAGVATLTTGREYVGIEIDERWCKVAAKRLRRAEEDTALFAEAEPSHKQLDLGDPA